MRLEAEIELDTEPRQSEVPPDSEDASWDMERSADDRALAGEHSREELEQLTEAIRSAWFGPEDFQTVSMYGAEIGPSLVEGFAWEVYVNGQPLSAILDAAGKAYYAEAVLPSLHATGAAGFPGRTEGGQVIDGSIMTIRDGKVWVEFCQRVEHRLEWDDAVPALPPLEEPPRADAAVEPMPEPAVVECNLDALLMVGARTSTAAWGEHALAAPSGEAPIVAAARAVISQRAFRPEPVEDAGEVARLAPVQEREVDTPLAETQGIARPKVHPRDTESVAAPRAVAERVEEPAAEEHAVETPDPDAPNTVEVSRAHLKNRLGERREAIPTLKIAWSSLSGTPRKDGGDVFEIGSTIERSASPTVSLLSAPSVTQHAAEPAAHSVPEAPEFRARDAEEAARAPETAAVPIAKAREAKVREEHGAAAHPETTESSVLTPVADETAERLRRAVRDRAPAVEQNAPPRARSGSGDRHTEETRPFERGEGRGLATAPAAARSSPPPLADQGPAAPPTRVRPATAR